MAAKLTRLTHKIAILLHLMAVLAPGGQCGNVSIHPRISDKIKTVGIFISGNYVQKCTAELYNSSL
jgi:hypothetical protein